VDVIFMSEEENKINIETDKGKIEELKTPYQIAKENEEKDKEEVSSEDKEHEKKTKIFTLRTTANREEQVMDFVTSNATKKGLEVFSIMKPHGMRGYIFLEAESLSDAEQAAYGIPYARGVLPKALEYREIEHMIETVKREINIQKNDIAEIIAGPFKREQCKIARVDKSKGEVVVELLEAAVPIPITLKLDDVKVIRREKE